MARKFYVKDGKFVKKGFDVNGILEAKNINYISSNTSIPVPQVVDYGIDSVSGEGYIEMEFIQGKTLEDKLFDMNSERIDKISRQLNGILSQLTTVSENYIGGTDPENYGIDDPIITINSSIRNIEEFNEALLNNVSSPMDMFLHVFRKMLFQNTHYKFVLTHGDLLPRNIIVDDEDNIKCILDWEVMGFYPEYWEFVKMGQYSWKSLWWKILSKLNIKYYQELSIFQVYIQSMIG